MGGGGYEPYNKSGWVGEVKVNMRVPCSVLQRISLVLLLKCDKSSLFGFLGCQILTGSDKSAKGYFAP